MRAPATCFDHVTCFLNKIIIMACSTVEHINRLDEVLSHLEKYGIRVKRAKCMFMRDKLEYLGHLIDREGLHPTEEKVTAVAPSPTNVTELCSFLVLRNYYSRSLENLSTLLQPLHVLLKKGGSLEMETGVRGSVPQRKEPIVAGY